MLKGVLSGVIVGLVSLPALAQQGVPPGPPIPLDRVTVVWLDGFLRNGGPDRERAVLAEAVEKAFMEASKPTAVPVSPPTVPPPEPPKPPAIHAPAVKNMPQPSPRGMSVPVK